MPPDPVTEVALAWQPPSSRPALATLFALDRRLASVIARAREPMLAQMRLAWWRERLAEAPAQRPAGEPLLADLNSYWGEASGRLSQLVDGWEHLLGEAPLPDEALEGFAAGRGAALASFAALFDPPQMEAAASAGRCWAFADLSGRTSHAQERERALELGRQEPSIRLAGRALRGVAVLGGLSRRALCRGEPLMAGRGAAVTAIRLGMFGG